MKIEGLTPILNVSNIVETFEWFAKLGWEKAWDWSLEENGPQTFGAVGNGNRDGTWSECELMLDVARKVAIRRGRLPVVALEDRGRGDRSGRWRDDGRGRTCDDSLNSREEWR